MIDCQYYTKGFRLYLLFVGFSGAIAILLIEQVACMQWSTLLSSQRLGVSPTLPSTRGDSGRTDFHKDHDRIVFSSAFRRLGRKTQVHPMSENDHVHTRLTHSIEVGSVGRSLGIRVGHALAADLPAHISPSDVGAIVQAACMAHDIGNPPFGHAGEYAIRDWFARPAQQLLLAGLNDAERSDLSGFEGNAQGLRVVTQLENHRFAGGLRLTYATLGTLLKYPWLSPHAQKGKFNGYQTEAAILQDIAQALGLPEISPGRWARHPLSYLMEAADDICYAILDLEDGIEIGLLSYQEVEPILIGLCGGPSDSLRAELQAAPSARRKISLLRGKAIEQLIRAVSAAFISQQAALLEGSWQGDLINACPVHLHEGIHNAKQLAKERIFNDRRKLEVEVGAYATLGVLLDAFCYAVHGLYQDAPLSFRHQRVLSLMEYNLPTADWSPYQAYMRVLDFIGGMTDNYAQYLAQQMGGLGRLGA